MTERDLSTLLRDDLAGEPALGRTSDEAIRTARRQTLRWRGLTAGAGVVAITTVIALGLGGGSDDAPSDTAVAAEPTVPLTEVMEAAATDSFTPYVGPLGAPSWSVNDLLADPVPPGDPRAQSYQLSYHPEGSRQLNLSVGGYAPEEWELYDFPSTCDHLEAEKLAASCTTTMLDDGSMLIVQVAPRSRIGSDSPRMLTLDDAASLPHGQVSWVRVVGLSTRDGLAVDASESVRADGVGNADWQVPVATLKALVLDAALRQAEVAHETMPAITDE